MPIVSIAAIFAVKAAVLTSIAAPGGGVGEADDSALNSNANSSAGANTDSPATAPDAAPIPEPCALEFTFTPGVWIPRLGGHAKLGPSSAAAAPHKDLSFEDDFDLDDTEFLFSGDASLRIGSLHEVSLSGFAFSTESSETFAGGSPAAFGDVTLAPGDAFSSSIDINSFAADLTFWTWNPVHTARPEATLRQTDLRFGPSIGLRYVGIDQDLSLDGVAGPAGRAGGSGDWIAPEAGIQLQMRTYLKDTFPLVRAFEIDGGLTVGPAVSVGGGGRAEIGGVVSLKAIMTAYFTDNFGVSFGYRLFGMDAESRDYEFDGSLEGLFFGAAIRF